MIHTTPVHQLMSCELKATCLMLNCHFWPKYESIIIIHNNTYSSEKVHPLLSSHIKNTNIFVLRVFFSVHISLLIQTYMPLFHWKHQFEVKNILKRFVSYKNTAFTSQDVDWWTVDYLWIIVMFLSAVWILNLTAPIHCRGSTGEQVMEC